MQISMHHTDRPDVFRALADPTRRALVELLAEGERPVNELADPFTVSRPAISQHLAILRAAGLVTERRVGRERRYRLQPAPLRDVHEWINRFEHFWQVRLDALGRHLDAATARDRDDDGGSSAST